MRIRTEGNEASEAGHILRFLCLLLFNVLHAIAVPRPLTSGLCFLISEFLLSVFPVTGRQTSDLAPFRPVQTNEIGFVLAGCGTIKTHISDSFTTTSDFSNLGSFCKNAFFWPSPPFGRDASVVDGRATLPRSLPSPRRLGWSLALPFPSVTDAYPPSSSPPQWPRRAAPFPFRVASPSRPASS